MIIFFYVLLTVLYLSILISVFNQTDAQNLFHNKFYFMHEIKLIVKQILCIKLIKYWDKYIDYCFRGMKKYYILWVSDYMRNPCFISIQEKYYIYLHKTIALNYTLLNVIVLRIIRVQV